MTEHHNQARGANEWNDTYGSLGMAAQTKMILLPIHLLDPWEYPTGESQPFDPYTQNMLEDMAENIRELGVIEPICVRPKPDGRFQIIAGHNRVESSKLAGLKVIPSQVRHLDDAQAEKLMIYSNLKHRPKLLPSEKARAYLALMKNLKRQGQRTDKTSDPLGPKSSGFRADLEVAGEVGESATNVKRYIRLSFLLPSFLKMVDNAARDKNSQDTQILSLAFQAGVELSYLSVEDQTLLLQVIKDTGSKAPSMSQAKLLRKLSQDKELNENSIRSIMVKVKSMEVHTVKLPAARISSFFPQNTSPEAMEAEIYEALLAYRKDKNTSASA